MKIVVDRTVAFIEGVLDPYAEIVYREGKDICTADVADADGLLIRTRTRCGSELLEGSRVKIISSASIGTDHIDSAWCSSHGIFVQNAAGCNAGGVMNYVFSALYGVAARKSIELSGMTMGIVGLGNVGTRVAQMALHLGFKVLCCDPPRAEAEGGDFCRLDELLELSDIVTLHVPLNDSTRRMAGKEFFERMRPGAFFINTARGEVVDEDCLIEARDKLGPVIIDTWNNEPYANRRLLQLADIATPHIAGYSYQGKQNGTAAAVRAIARYFDIKPLFEFFPEADVEGLEAVRLDLHGLSQGAIASCFQYNYPIFTDDFMFRLAPNDFERLRRDYRYRREFYVDL